MTDRRKRFDDLRRNGQIAYDDLEVWSLLAPVEIDFMIGEWKGGHLPTGHRGEVTATMVYDGVPIHDHFKKIDDNAVLAIMNGKGALDEGRYMYFYLERV
jgi:Domain of unknown function (DUF4334)/GXWXG protein